MSGHYCLEVQYEFHCWSTRKASESRGQGRVDRSEWIKPTSWSGCGKVLGYLLVQLKESVFRLCTFVSPEKPGFTSLVAERTVV